MASLANRKEYEGRVLGSDRTVAADSRGVSPRTFALDPSGRMLVAANSEAMWVKTDAEVKWMPASLAVFGVLEDGRLEFRRKYDVELGPKEKLLWMGIVAY